jgi:hypothetical protein
MWREVYLSVLDEFVTLSILVCGIQVMLTEHNKFHIGLDKDLPKTFDIEESLKNIVCKIITQKALH